MDFNSLKVTTPDPTKYHPGSGYGTTIPRSAAEGQSRGFDPNVPTSVIVDPGMPDGGFVLNVAALSKNPQEFNMAASREGVIGDVTSFYRHTQSSAQDAEPPVAELTQATWGELQDVQEENAGLDSVSEQTDLRSQVAHQAVLLNELYAAVVRSDERNRKRPIPDDPYMVMLPLIDELAKLGVASPAARKPPSGEPKGDLGFASLQIPFLTGVKPERPQYETYFEMPKLGTMSARYHVVVPGRDCLALIYDTRFEDGFQYLPPNLGEEIITVSVPKLKKAYQCSSLGLHWTLGCLDVVMLLMHKEEAQ